MDKDEQIKQLIRIGFEESDIDMCGACGDAVAVDRASAQSARVFIGGFPRFKSLHPVLRAMSESKVNMRHSSTDKITSR